MWEYLIASLVVSTLVVGACYYLKFYHDVNVSFPVFFGIGIIGSLAIAIGIYAGAYQSQVTDYEIWNGEVTRKEKVEVSCSHSYSCNCRESCSGSGSSKSCSTTCDTCYEHSNDYDWRVYTNVEDFNIERIDRQGSSQPKRWTKVQKGDPVAIKRSHTNYVKAVDASLFNFNTGVNTSLDKYVPAYPYGVYDYHYLDRVLMVNMPAIQDLPRWNYELALRLRQLGPQKQANVIVMMAKLDDPNFEYSVRKQWLGAKKNDVVVILGTPNYPEISWVRIVSWTEREDFKVQLRDALQELKTVDMIPVLNTIQEHTVKTFTRKRMRDFEYLKSEILIPDWAFILGIILGPLCVIGFTLFMVYTDYKNNNRMKRLNGMFNNLKRR